MLRRKLTDAKKLIGFSSHNTSSVLQSNSLLKYKDKFKCILIPSHLEEMERQAALRNDEPFDVRRASFFLQHSLHVPVVTVTNLSVQPGDRRFVLWLMVSAYFPLISACLAPLANLVSLIGLIQNWRLDPVSHREYPETPPVLRLNIVAFVLGILGNVSLVLNFSGLFRYSFTQCTSIVCWVLAATLLMAAVLVTARNPVPGLVYSEGFWLAVFTVGMYYLCSLVMLFNYIGYWRQKYPATLNLTRKQRSLMSFTISFCVWQAVSTVAVSKLFPDLPYGTALYYCTVSMLTIGLGDIIPKTPGAKVYALVFSFVGVLIMGLIVSVLRQVVLTSAGPSIFWHHVESLRRKTLEKMARDTPGPSESPNHTSFRSDSNTMHSSDSTAPISDNVHSDANPTDKVSFATIRHIRQKVQVRQERRSLLWTVAVFISFWLLGALAFSRIEKWNYFNGVYFCFLCLLTIGYGDFHPETQLGRVFFVIWAIAAVPLMTILVSNAGDHIYDMALKVDSFTTSAFSFRTYIGLFSHGPGSKKPDDPELRPRNEVPVAPRTPQEAQILKTQEVSKSLSTFEELFVNFMDHPSKEYNLKEWREMLEYFQVHDLAEENFWMGEFSPLKLPIKESNYLLMTVLMKMSKDLKDLQEMQNRQKSQKTTYTNQEPESAQKSPG